MNKKVFSGILVIMAIIVLVGCEQVQKETAKEQVKTQEYVVDSSDNVKPHSLISEAEKGELSEEEKGGLIFMREEEKLARDVYATLYEKWGQQIFTNISESEQTHTDTVKFLLDKYGVDDPVVDDAVGVFASEEMQELYDSLVVKGETSLTEALTVGAIVEDLDISDLEKLLAQTDNEDIQIAYQNLMKGSRNHLRAFTRQLERNGEDYSPQYIDESTYQEIITGQQERGNVDAQGQMSGNGQGSGKNKGEGRGMNQTQ
ncbi:MAG: DUF2202 domain-containing protein [Patescibacteria group bacterium]